MIRATLGRLLLAALVVLVLASARAHAQRSTSDPRLDLRVVPDAQGCMTEASLRARVLHYLSPRAQPAKVRIAVDADQTPVRFSLQRGGAAVAERRFDLLPAACDDRLDAVALAIALAVEHATNPASTVSAGRSGNTTGNTNGTASSADDNADPAATAGKDAAAAAAAAAAPTANTDQPAAAAAG